MPASNFRRRVTYRVAVDEENPAETWWDAARASTTVPDAIQPLLSCAGPGELLLTRREAVEAEAWAASLPGYADGPAHARTALLFQRR